MLALARNSEHEPHGSPSVKSCKDSDRLSQDGGVPWRTSRSTLDSVEDMDQRTYDYH